MKIVIVILLTALLIVVLRLIRLGLKRLTIRYSRIKFSDNIRAVFEFVIWLIYTFMAIDFLFKEKFYFSYLIYSLILIVTGFVSWFLLKDIIAGIIFRGKQNLRTSSYIRAGSYTGKIISHKLTYLRIMTEDGQFIRIPYSRIIHEVITELALPNEFAEHILSIQVGLPAGKSNEAEELIRSVILNSPWSNLKTEHLIKLIKENQDGYLFEIKLFSAKPDQIKNIEMSLRSIAAIHIL